MRAGETRPRGFSGSRCARPAPTRSAKRLPEATLRRRRPGPNAGSARRDKWLSPPARKSRSRHRSTLPCVPSCGNTTRTPSPLQEEPQGRKAGLALPCLPTLRSSVFPGESEGEDQDRQDPQNRRSPDNRNWIDANWFHLLLQKDRECDHHADQRKESRHHQEEQTREDAFDENHSPILAPRGDALYRASSELFADSTPFSETHIPTAADFHNKSCATLLGGT